jgi:hypothetical protein
MGSMPRSTRTSEARTTCHDSRSASAAQSLAVLFTHTRAFSSSTGKSHLAEGCRSRSSSSTSIAVTQLRWHSHWRVLFTHVRAFSSSTSRSHLAEGCRPRSSSSTNIASRTSRSVSCRHRRDLRSSNARLRVMSYPDWEWKAHTCVKKSC